VTSEARPKRRFIGRVAPWLAIVLFVAFVAGISFPAHGPQKSGCQWISAIHMQKIAIAASLYSQQHGGTYPEKLSQLVPDYIEDSGAFYFTCRYGTTFKPLNADSEPKLIDIFSPYSLLAIGEGRAIVFERISMWPDATIGFHLIPDDNSLNGSLQHRRLAPDDFARQFLNDFKP
jgi:hypothetical protein